jgi:beta-lactamase regulating signal transducer with metallopeptidase domain
LLILYLLTKKEIRGARHFRDNIYICKAVGTPTVYGIFKPKIILPCEVDDEKLKHILAHEAAHIRRNDNLRRILALIICCFHWFNPFVWLFLRTYLSDMETSCDRAAIKSLSSEDRKTYAHTLLDFAPAKRTLVSSTLTGASIKLRIENVLSYKRMSVISVTALVAATIAIIYTLMTNSV